MTVSSYFSNKHLTFEDKQLRTSKYYHSLANIFKGYIGITMIILPYGFSEVGIYGAILSILLVMGVNIYTVSLVIKARNKYKRT